VVRSRRLGSQGHQAWGGEIDEAERAAGGSFERVAWGRMEVKAMKQSERRVNEHRGGLSGMHREKSAAAVTWVG
jgi:hypothetical protein